MSEKSLIDSLTLDIICDHWSYTEEKKYQDGHGSNKNNIFIPQSWTILSNKDLISSFIVGVIHFIKKKNKKKYNDRTKRERKITQKIVTASEKK